MIHLSNRFQHADSHLVLQVPEQHSVDEHARNFILDRKRQRWLMSVKVRILDQSVKIRHFVPLQKVSILVDEGPSSC